MSRRRNRPNRSRPSDPTQSNGSTAGDMDDETEIDEVDEGDVVDEVDEADEAEVEAPQPIDVSEVPEGAVLVTSKLGKDYGDGMGLVGLDLEVDPGELVMLVEPTSGDAWIHGAKLGTITARAATSYLPDAPVLYDDLSLNEHIEYIARMHNTQEWEEYADDLLEIFNLVGRADDLPSRFSRGLKQKTALILGLIRPFTLLLIDEPFVGLDTPGQEALVEILGDVAEQGAAIVCSTHQMDLTPKATRCIGLRDGEKSYDGPVSAEKIRSLVGG